MSLSRICDCVIENAILALLSYKCYTFIASITTIFEKDYRIETCQFKTCNVINGFLN